ncbi:uncharacterized protein L201_001065 [Kwoniella dendrophila CBS 6074]|uniref:Protein kinase domain-containing protein n=1 Tax=Kwoniella dendrophila CBS 6074 TaxID=1295534 RepID=A0AAX4JLA3_9TREE
MHKFDVLHWGIHRDHVCQRENDGEIRLIDFHRSDKTDKTVRLAWEQHEAENYLGLAKRMQYASFIAKFKEEAAKKKMEEGAVIVEKSNDIPNNKRKRDNA